MDSRRRNYTQIFHQLDVLVNSSMTHASDKRLQVWMVQAAMAYAKCYGMCML